MFPIHFLFAVKGWICDLFCESFLGFDLNLTSPSVLSYFNLYKTLHRRVFIEPVQINLLSCFHIKSFVKFSLDCTSFFVCIYIIAYFFRIFN